ncbi:hypothetical protein AGRA3207_004325 [Actinomadura graeca]|uniref:Uncharacterized protein n=1 Tax=Actinomadura graeca TaxID=2750812 RepID=A0ABX8R2H1_9ACTN|nr:hypothetical protein [Actinomadura graeca]QXJ23198.1 hypothetical protein AGRA3207_004325 [Actinomadura graeca]
MHRSARNLLSVSVLVPAAAALAVATAPSSAARGPSAELLYGTVAPVAHTLPSDVVPEPTTAPAGHAAKLTTGTVDGVLKDRPTRPRPRTARDAGASRCILDDLAKPFSIPAGTGRRACPENQRRAKPNPNNPVDAAGKVVGSTSKVVGNASKATKKVQAGPLGKVAAVTRSASTTPLLRNARRASDERRGLDAMGVVPGAVRSAEAAGLPVSYAALFPPAHRRALGRPAPDQVLDQAGDVVRETATGVDATRGQVVEVLKADDRPATRPAAMPIKQSQMPPGMAQTARTARPKPPAGPLNGLPRLPVNTGGLPTNGLV